MPEIRIVRIDPSQPCGVFDHGGEMCGQLAEYATVEPVPSHIAGSGYLVMLPICRAHAGNMAEVYRIDQATYDLTAAEFADVLDREMISSKFLPDLPHADADLILVTASVRIPHRAEPPILEAAARLMDQAIARMMKDSEKLRERARRAVEGN